MNEHARNNLSLAMSLLALIASFIAIWQVQRQHNADYDAAIVVQPGALPVAQLPKGPFSLTIEVANTSNSNIRYFLVADSNMGCLDGANGKPRYVPCGYESQVVSLSNTATGRNTHQHTLHMDARPGAIAIHPMAYISGPGYNLRIKIIDAQNGRTLYLSDCYYLYHVQAETFALDQPAVDTSGTSERLQVNCHP